MTRSRIRRLVAIHALGLSAVAVCLAAASWQWQRAHAGQPAAAAAVEFERASPLRQYLPLASIGRRTTVMGEWVAGFRWVVPRASGDGPGVLTGRAVGSCPWVVDALRLADGSAVAVVRGCGTAETPIASGRATITGLLQPSEDSDLIGFTTNAITTSDLAASLPSTVHDGYLVADQPAPGLQQVTPILPQRLSAPLHWRNIVYVGNWLIFAVIIIVMWRRVVQDELAEPPDQEEQHGR